VIVISDTSPITNLTDVSQIELLRLLFGRVIIPQAVSQELARGRVTVPEWIEVHHIRDRARVVQFENENELDLGEAEALVLAVELEADRLLSTKNKGARLRSAWASATSASSACCWRRSDGAISLRSGRLSMTWCPSPVSGSADTCVRKFSMPRVRANPDI
jgi:hypothetical protein